MANFIFTATNTDGSADVYATDGTPSGTVDLAMSRFDFLGGLEGPVIANGELNFVGSIGPGEPYSPVFTTDGTASGTSDLLLVDTSGPGAGPIGPSGMWDISGKLVVAGAAFTGGGFALFSDGQEIENNVAVGSMAVNDGVGIFAGTIDAGQNGPTALWRTDGTVAGTYSLTPAGQIFTPENLIPLDNGLTIFANTVPQVGVNTLDHRRHVSRYP